MAVCRIQSLGGFFFLGNVCVLKGKGVGVKAVRRAVVKFP